MKYTPHNENKTFPKPWYTYDSQKEEMKSPILQLCCSMKMPSTFQLQCVSTYLTTEVDEICVRIIEWEHNTIACVQLHHNNRFWKMFWCSEGILSFGHFAKTRCKDETTFKEDGSCCFWSFMTHCFLCQRVEINRWFSLEVSKWNHILWMANLWNQK